MSGPATLPPVRTDIFRPAATGLKARLVAVLIAWGLDHIDVLFAALRRLRPILLIGRIAAVTRHDDVREIFLADADFPVPYATKLDVIMGHEPFFLGMGDTPEYRRDTHAMRSVIQAGDLDRLRAATLARGQALIGAASGRIEVVDQLARNVTFDVLCAYFGISDTPDAALRRWATRLFEFQFADFSNDASLRAEVDIVAPALRAHVNSLIAARRVDPAGYDDVLSRCLRKQFEAASGADARGLDASGFSDTQIRSALIGFLVGGLPQPPMVVPQALEQLLRRPDALAGAQSAALADDDELLGGYVFEALRFDPLAPALKRDTARDRIVAEGTARATLIPKGRTMFVSFASAMMDPRRVNNPERFEPRRPANDYMHFGYGLHTCFGLHINLALVPLMLKPLLQRPHLRRATGRAGHLVKRGAFADTLWVEFG